MIPEKIQSLKKLEKAQTLIFIFIHKITPKNMQDLVFFLQKNDFNLKKITKKNNRKNLTSIFVNSNFILESKQKIRSQQLKNVIFFLNQTAQVNGIFFQNQILDLKRIVPLETLEKQPLFDFWKQINNYIL